MTRKALTSFSHIVEISILESRPMWSEIFYFVIFTK